MEVTDDRRNYDYDHVQWRSVMKWMQIGMFLVGLLAMMPPATAVAAAETEGAENLARAAVSLEGEGVQDWFQVPGRTIVQGSAPLNDGKPDTVTAVPAGRNATVGLEWVRELFVGKLVVRFTGAAPQWRNRVGIYTNSTTTFVGFLYTGVPGTVFKFR